MPDYNDQDWQDLQRAERNVASWLTRRAAEEVRGHLVAAAVLTPLALVAALGTAFGLGVVILAVIGRPVLRNADMQWLWFGCMAAGLGIVLASFPWQYLRWRGRQTAVSLHGGGLAVDDDRHRPVFLIPTAEARESDWDLADILMFPATLAGMAIQHLAAARRLATCDRALVARVLTVLARQGRRMSVYDVEMAIGDAGLPGALRALRHIPGVLWWTRDTVAVSINDDLQAEIAHQGGWRT